jgi:cytosine/uracil/thiamine/allantoin permease
MANTQTDNPLLTAMHNSEKEWTEEKLTQAWGNMAKSLWGYFSALTELGFEREEALQIVMQFQGAVSISGIVERQFSKFKEKIRDA